MFFKKTIGLIKEMYHNGGLEVRTPIEGVAPPESFARTIIQPDGDSINIINKAIIKEYNNDLISTYRDKHQKNIEQKMAIIRRWRKFLKRSPYYGFIIVSVVDYFVWFYPGISPEKFFQEMQEIWKFIPKLLPNIFPLFIRFFIIIVLKIRIKVTI